MTETIDTVLEAAFGSRARLLTLAALANSDEPLTGYRVAVVANLPRPKVYVELRKGIEAGLLERVSGGFRLSDPDLRTLLRKRVRIRWDAEWDRSRKRWNEETAELLRAGLEEVRGRIRQNPDYLRPPGWKSPPEASRWQKELERPPQKDRVLRPAGLRTSKREDWVQ